MIRYVYIAGPLTGKHQDANVKIAVDTAARLRRRGLVPFCPHTATLEAMITGESDYELWLAWDFAWIKKCDAMLRLPGESAGSDREVAYAQEHEIPVFYNEQDLYAAANPPLIPPPAPKCSCAAPVPEKRRDPFMWYEWVIYCGLCAGFIGVSDDTDPML